MKILSVSSSGGPTGPVLTSTGAVTSSLTPSWSILLILTSSSFSCSLISSSFFSNKSHKHYKNKNAIKRFFIHYCKTPLINVFVNIGYFGIVVLFMAVALEAYHLYEHHKKYVRLLLLVGALMSVITAALFYAIPLALMCT